MHPSGLSKMRFRAHTMVRRTVPQEWKTRCSLGALVLLASLGISGAQQQLTCKDGRCERVIYGVAPAQSKLRVLSHGPVTLEAGTSKNLSYTVVVSVKARTEAEGRRVLNQYAVRVQNEGPWTVLSAPGGAAISEIKLNTPKLAAAYIVTSGGLVNATGIDGSLDVDSLAGGVSVDRIRGDCKLATGGGPVKVGEVMGALRCITRAGDISARSVHGDALLQTMGGVIHAAEVSGLVRADTGGGDVHIGSAGGTVNATSGGGEIIVEKAGGIVTVRNMGGPVQVRSAPGVRCESNGGGVRVSNISGPMRVSTSMGSILANMLAGRLGDSYLATGSGDITVFIPSNVGVTIEAQNSMADTLRRIVSDFRELEVKRQGARVIAAGAINGGGPVLQISGTGGTIFIKRQQ